MWDASYEVDIGPHVFPTRKYRMILDRLVAEDTIEKGDVCHPDSATDSDVGLVHTAEYIGKINANRLSPQEQQMLEVPLSRELRDAMWLCAGGTYLTGRLAVELGVAVHIGGGFHHAFPDHGEGFCLINDVALATRMLQAAGGAQTVPRA